MTEMGGVLMGDHDAPEEKLSATGRAQPGVTVDVRDIDGNPVDVDGELMIHSASLFHGYLKQPDATAASFTEDGFFRTGYPFTGEPMCSMPHCVRSIALSA